MPKESHCSVESVRFVIRIASALQISGGRCDLAYFDSRYDVDQSSASPGGYIKTWRSMSWGETADL